MDDLFAFGGKMEDLQDSSWGIIWDFFGVSVHFLAPVWLILQDLQPGSYHLAKRLQHDAHIGTCGFDSWAASHGEFLGEFLGEWPGMATLWTTESHVKYVNLRLQPNNSEGPKCDVISTGRMHWWGDSMHFHLTAPAAHSAPHSLHMAALMAPGTRLHPSCRKWRLNHGWPTFDPLGPKHPTVAIANQNYSKKMVENMIWNLSESCELLPIIDYYSR